MRRRTIFTRSLAVAQGKALTLPAAKVSGIMESIEVCHAERIHLPVWRGSYSQLARHHQLLDLHRLNRPQGSTVDLEILRQRVLLRESREMETPSTCRVASSYGCILCPVTRR